MIKVGKLLLYVLLLSGILCSSSVMAINGADNAIIETEDETSHFNLEEAVLFLSKNGAFGYLPGALKILSSLAQTKEKKECVKIMSILKREKIWGNKLWDFYKESDKNLDVFVENVLALSKEQEEHS